MIKLFMFAAIVAAVVVPALAQSKDCTEENKAAWYDTFLKNRQGEAPQQKAAYEAAKNYLGSCPDDPADAIRTYLAKWVKAYEGAKAIAENKNKLQDAYTKKNYSEAVSAGKQVARVRHRSSVAKSTAQLEQSITAYPVGYGEVGHRSYLSKQPLAGPSFWSQS